MAQVSRKYLSPKVQKRIFNLFLSSFTLCSNRENAASFIEDLLTPTEKIVLAKRVSIAFMLLSGYDYDTIKKTLKVSSPTVAGVSLWLKEKGEGYRQIINKIQRHEKTKEAWLEIVDTIEATLSNIPGSDRSIVRKRIWQRQQKRQKAF